MQTKKFDSISIIILASLVLADIFIWYTIVFSSPRRETEMYFLDVGQGDAELAIFPHNVKVLTDAGPDQKILRALEGVLNETDRYIDIAIITHPQLDHYNGFNYLIDRYTIGAFIFNGRSAPPDSKEWSTLLEKIRTKNIPLITIRSGDKIKYGDINIDFLSPDPLYIQSEELNDTSIVELIKTPQFKILLTGDIGMNIERFLVENRESLRANVLKIPHHGSKYSSSDEFLRAITPNVAIIEVGNRNRYGHPTKEALLRIASSTHAQIFRTDYDGTVKVLEENNKLKVFTHL